MPTVRDLESAHYELQIGPYPEFNYSEKEEPLVESRMEQKAASFLQWLTRPFARSPTSISEKREALLPQNEGCASSRSSTDVESQTCTSASTICGNEREQKKTERIDARIVSDAIIGLSDGLTVPFALTAGLSALGSTKVVIYAGLAELTAGAISMGLGGYLGAKSEEESYKVTLADTKTMVNASSADAAISVKEIFEPYDLPQSLTEDLAFHLAKSPNLVQFLMHFQHSQPEQAASRAFTCALTIALGYFLGGFTPLLPYFFVAQNEVILALWWSLGVMGVSLFAFGYGKTCFVCGWRGRQNTWKGTKGGLQMMIVGGVAAGCAMALVRIFNHLSGQE